MVESIIAIVSTVIGTILGWILAKVDTGRLYINLDDFLCKPSYVNGNVMSIPGKKPNELYAVEYSFRMQLYNSSLTNKSLSDCKLMFFNKSNTILLELPIKDKSTGHVSGGCYITDTLDVINLEAKSGMNINAVVYSQELEKIMQTASLKVTYKTKNFKTKVIKFKNIELVQFPMFCNDDRES